MIENVLIKAGFVPKLFRSTLNWIVGSPARSSFLSSSLPAASYMELLSYVLRQIRRIDGANQTYVTAITEAIELR